MAMPPDWAGLLADEAHVLPVTLTRRQRAQAVYEWLRAANPHLPAPEKVLADGVAFHFGPDQLATVALTVVIEMPDVPLPPGGD
jgi:hypothetical protein